MTQTFDRRLTPARGDIAAAYLKGVVEAERYVQGVQMEVKEGVVDLRREPRPDAPVDTQVLYGERVTVYDEEEGWAWAQLAHDGYVGWIAANTLWSELSAPTHRVCVPRTFVYPAASIKTPPHLALPLSAEVAIVDARDAFLVTRDWGFIWRSHLAPLDAPAQDFVAVAETLIGAPYLWGGKSSIGVDCSGLVQIALAAAGIAGAARQRHAGGAARPARRERRAAASRRSRLLEGACRRDARWRDAPSCEWNAYARLERTPRACARTQSARRRGRYYGRSTPLTTRSA